MAFDPQVETLIHDFAERAKQSPRPPVEDLTPEVARARYRALAEFLGPGPDVHAVEEWEIPGPAGGIPARLYRPAEPHGLLVYFHGGGFVLGDLETHDHLCRTLCTGAGCSLLSVDYRLAPEHRFPAAVEDAESAVVWAAENVGELAAHGAKVAVGGDLAGGNLAAVTALLARDRNGPDLAFQLLIYPWVDMRLCHRSMDESSGVFLMTRDFMKWFVDHYLDGGDPDHPMASPLLAESHSRLPPALVITAEHDPLRDEGIAFAEKLEAAGVPTRLSHYPGQVHLFVQLAPMLDGGQKALTEATAALHSALA